MTAADSPSPETPPGGDFDVPHTARVGRATGTSKSALYWMWRRLTVWMPALSNPHERRCMIRYEPRDARSGMRWTVVVPRQCWKCGKEEELDPERFDVDLKVYHQPVMIVSVSLAIIVLILTVMSCFGPWWMALFLVGSVTLGAALLLKFKSWWEEVRLHMWTCRDHVAELSQPDMVIEDEALHIFLPTPELTKAASADLKQRRRQGGRSIDASGGSTSTSTRQAATDREQPKSATPPPPPGTPGRTRKPHVPEPHEELPPIRLAGDDEEHLVAPADQPAKKKTKKEPSSTETRRPTRQPHHTPSRVDDAAESAPPNDDDDDAAWFDD